MPSLLVRGPGVRALACKESLASRGSTCHQTPYQAKQSRQIFSPKGYFLPLQSCPTPILYPFPPPPHPSVQMVKGAATWASGKKGRAAAAYCVIPGTPQRSAGYRWPRECSLASPLPHISAKVQILGCTCRALCTQ